MTKLNNNGVSECANGEEWYDTFTPKHLKGKRFVQYDYRHTDGKLFSTVAPTLKECRKKRDNWLDTLPELFVIDLNGNKITVDHLDKAIEQAKLMKGYWHEDRNFAQTDNRLSAYWMDIYDKLTALKANSKQH